MTSSGTMRKRPAPRGSEGEPDRGSAMAPPGRRRAVARLRHAAHAAGTFWLTAGAAAGALAQGFGGGGSGASFKAAPRAAEAEAADQGPDTILGIIEINTAFFIAVGVIAFFWFVFGGGRKAKVGNAPK